MALFAAVWARAAICTRGDAGHPLSQLYDKEASCANISDCVYVIYHKLLFINDFHPAEIPTKVN